MKSQQIIDHIAHQRECTAADILGYARTQHIADGRAIAQYVLREQGWTWQRIADRFDCHHSAVIHNWKKVDKINNLKIKAKNIIDNIAKLTNMNL